MRAKRLPLDRMTLPEQDDDEEHLLGRERQKYIVVVSRQVQTTGFKGSCYDMCNRKVLKGRCKGGGGIIPV